VRRPGRHPLGKYIGITDLLQLGDVTAEPYSGCYHPVSCGPYRASIPGPLRVVVEAPALVEVYIQPQMGSPGRRPSGPSGQMRVCGRHLLFSLNPQGNDLTLPYEVVCSPLSLRADQVLPHKAKIIISLS
jgi:hypothetical protein